MKLEIVPISSSGPCQSGSLRRLDFADIERVLGFSANCLDDPDKVTHSWGFTVDGVHCGIWDYKGYKFSYYGPKETMVNLFGEDHVSE